MECALHTLEGLYRNAGQKPDILVFSAMDYGMKATRDRLIEEKEVRSKLIKAAGEAD